VTTRLSAVEDTLSRPLITMAGRSRGQSAATPAEMPEGMIQQQPRWHQPCPEFGTVEAGLVLAFLSSDRWN